MQPIVKFEVEILASVGGLSGHFGGHSHPFPDDQHIQKRNHIPCVSFQMNWMKGLKTIEVAEEIL
jgi:hypothetical protein